MATRQAGATLGHETVYARVMAMSASGLLKMLYATWSAITYRCTSGHETSSYQSTMAKHGPNN